MINTKDELVLMYVMYNCIMGQYFNSQYGLLYLIPWRKSDGNIKGTTNLVNIVHLGWVYRVVIQNKLDTFQSCVSHKWENITFVSFKLKSVKFIPIFVPH